MWRFWRPFEEQKRKVNLKIYGLGTQTEALNQKKGEQRRNRFNERTKTSPLSALKRVDLHILINFSQQSILLSYAVSHSFHFVASIIVLKNVCARYHQLQLLLCTCSNIFSKHACIEGLALLYLILSEWNWLHLILSWRRPLSYRNQSTNLLIGACAMKELSYIIYLAIFSKTLFFLLCCGKQFLDYH